VPGHALNAAAVAGNDDLAADPAAQHELVRLLDAHFGTPLSPHYAVLAGWEEEGFDPNHWTLDEGGTELRERIAADNRERFEGPLRAIAEGRFDEVEPPLGAPDLHQSWLEHLGRERGPTWLPDAVRLFTDYYPSPAASAAVFRGICARCHGDSGGGDGPMAARLRTRPRDYRQGRFKRTPLADRARPRHADLVGTIQQGIEGTAMPRFGKQLSLSQIAGLADHVRLLSIRGETEILTAFDFEAGGGVSGEMLRANYELVVDRWRSSADHLIVASSPPPEATAERIAHGRDLFLGPRGAGCVRCHGETGHGDGPAALVTDPATGVQGPFHDDWGHPIRPRDLVCSPFRFGDRPIDLFCRMHAGINGTPMPAHRGFLLTDADGSRRPLDDDDLWDLVLYVESLRGGPH